MPTEISKTSTGVRERFRPDALPASTNESIHIATSGELHELRLAGHKSATLTSIGLLSREWHGNETKRVPWENCGYRSNYCGNGEENAVMPRYMGRLTALIPQERCNRSTAVMVIDWTCNTLEKKIVVDKMYIYKELK